MKKLLVLFIVALFVAPVMATADPQWDMYGSARVQTTYYSLSEEQITPTTINALTEGAVTGAIGDITVGTTGGAIGGAVGGTDGFNDDTDLRFSLHQNARIGAKVKVSDEVSGRFEYGHGKGGVNGQGVRTRLLFGQWNFGAGKLLVGQHYRPSFVINSTSMGNTFGNDTFDDTNLLAHGTPYNSRDTQVRLTFGNFAIALIEPPAATLTDLDDGTAYNRTDRTLPVIEASYDIKTDLVNVKVYGGYQSSDAETTGTAADESQDSVSITAMLFGANAQFKFGPGYVKAGGYYAQNASNYGIALPRGALIASSAYLLDGDVQDSTTTSAQLVGGFKANDMVRIEAGVGMVQSEVEIDDVKLENGSTCYYVQVPLTLAKGVTLFPEIGMVDDGDFTADGEDIAMGSFTYYGVKFQIDF